MNARTQGAPAGRRWLPSLGAVIGLALLSGIAIATTPSDRPDVMQKQATYQVTIEGDLYVGPDGTVTDYQLRSDDLSQVIAGLVDKQVRSWRFEPILVDGRAVRAKTSLKLALTVSPVAGGYRLHVAGVGFGNPVRRSQGLKPPEYPSLASRAGVGGEVMLVLTVDGSGDVVEADVESTSLSGKGPQRVVEQYADMFEYSAKAAARRWHFDMTERIDGKAMTTRVRVPVSFRIAGVKGWTAMVPVLRPGHYLESHGHDDAQLAAAGDSATQEPQALNTRFRLKDEVVGRAL